MTSFGLETTTLSVRKSVSETSLINWYKLLWNKTFPGPEIEPVCIDECILSTLEKDLCKLLHEHPRDDQKIINGLMRVWGLCHHMQKCEKNDDICFDILFKETYSLEEYLDSAAFFIVGHVPRELVPVEFQRPGILQEADNFCELTDNGIMLLYAHWHIKLMKNKLAVISSPVDDDITPLSFDVTFSMQDITRLDAINGCANLQAQDIYMDPSNMNIYSRIKESSLNEEDKYDLAMTLFEFNPETYNSSLIGKILLFCKKSGFDFCYGDEIFWLKGKLIWVWYDAEQKYISVSIQGNTLFTTDATMAGLNYLIIFLEDTSHNLSL
jgi:hypothetical protein